MQIDSKYNLGDKVYFLKDNYINSGSVIGIRFAVTIGRYGEKNQNFTTEAEINMGIYLEVKTQYKELSILAAKCFKSKEDLTKDLLSK